MAQPFIGQLLFGGFDFAPRGFAACDGQLLAIAQNQALFSLVGTRYGGNGVQTFALPDLRSRTMVGAGTGNSNGTVVGAETVTLALNQLPIHNHAIAASTATGDNGHPGDTTFATAASNVYGAASGLVALNSSPTNSAGGNQPHPNLQPYQATAVSIALQGVFPSRN